MEMTRRERALSDRVAQLEKQTGVLREALSIAAGLISTMPDRAGEHPVDVYTSLIHEALGDRSARPRPE